jgi:F420-non-reducing hydrogenase iron-sulfur subunit
MLLCNVRQLNSCVMSEETQTHRTDRAVKTYVFYCSNHPQAGELGLHCRGQAGDTLKAISLPCSGKIDLPYLLKAFETGADGMVILTCSNRECRHVEGPLRARKRAQAVESLLDEIGVARGRITLLEWEREGLTKALGEIGRFCEQLRGLPPVFATPPAVRESESATA